MASTSSVMALRRFVSARGAKERCDHCGTLLPIPHRHQFDLQSRRIRCACSPCAELHSRIDRDIPTNIHALSHFEISDTQWDDLLIPISLAFFTYNSALSRVVALYPGPAGASESSLRLQEWNEIALANPELQAMQPDVQALLVNRVSHSREYFIVPIDECYKLVGIIRMRWSGLSGGAAVWGEITAFFDSLRKRATACPT